MTTPVISALAPVLIPVRVIGLPPIILVGPIEARAPVTLTRIVAMDPLTVFWSSVDPILVESSQYPGLWS